MISQKNRDKITDITEHQQLRLFELTYRNYVNDSIKLYNKYKKDSVSWEALHPTLKDVFVDMKSQGALNYKMVPIFGLNKKDDIIRLIQENPILQR